MILLMAVFLCAAMAQAAEYEYLVFTNTSGNHTALSVTNMTLTVSGTTLQVKNNSETVNFTLTQLASMQFSKDGSNSGIDQVLDVTQPIKVFNISGALIGAYPSLIDAAQSLNTGAYVISNGSVTQTVVIR